MTQNDFRLFCSEAEDRGFNHVLTAAGAVPVALWHPYGCFADGQPEHKHLQLNWITINQAADTPPEQVWPGTPYGIWTFLP